MKKVSVTGLVVLYLCFSLSAREQKEYDYDLIYDESKIPAYTLPNPLITDEGELVTTIEDWNHKRRPQILSSFSNLIYGQIPYPAYPIQTEYEVVKEDKEFMDGKATRRDVMIRFSNQLGSVEMLILVYLPNQGEKPYPMLMKHSFNNTKSDDFDIHPTHPKRLKNNWPLGEIIDRGYGFVAVYQQDLTAHNEVEFLKGIHKLFYPEGQSFPHANEWGVLSTVAWGAMRSLDYLETVDEANHNKVAIMGHSKMGKAALWTAAQDQRFALAVSAQSGCAGAALWRRRSGETLEKMVTRFPYWLCRNAWKFVGQEEDLPVDQHMLLSLIAPRPVYVYSAIEDTWADPHGEYLSAYHSSKVYELFGKTGLQSDELPNVNQPIIKSQVGYHIREGGHSVEQYDWFQLLDFMDYHFTN